MRKKKVRKLNFPVSSEQIKQYPQIISYKNVYLLRWYITFQGKIYPRRLTKLTAKQHRFLTKSVKRVRFLGLLPFINKEK